MVASAPAAAAPAPATTPSVPAAAPVAFVPPVPAAAVAVNPESLAALTGMGFPEAECRAALQAAMGNPDMAYEFLLTGIPDRVSRRQAAPPAAPTAGAGVVDPASLAGIQQLRQHPQFNMLKQLIQTNPAALPQVLTLIGQQSPALLAAIHANEAEFLTLMNEPISAAPVAVASPPLSAPISFEGVGAAAGAAGGPGPAQMIQLLAQMPPAQRAQFASTLGLSPEQLNMFMEMVATMPPDQLQQMLAAGGAGAGHTHAHPPPGAITLTHEEMESVNRLVALGFSQAQAAQAYIACDKNEALAANFLFENGWGDEGDFGGEEGHDEEDDMYN